MDNSISTLAQDLKELIDEAREKSPFLFASAESAARFSPRQPAAAMPRPAPKAPPKQPPVKASVIVKEPEAPKTPAPSPVFERETPASKEASPFADPSIAKRIQKLYPGWKLAEHPPSDEEAVKIASSWKIRAAATEVLVLLFSSKPAVRTFLQNFANALQQLGRPTQLIDARQIEKENMWEAVLGAPQLKTIYASPLEGWNAPHLLKYVTSVPATGEHFLGKSKCALHLLQEAEVYIHSPLQKRLLWQQVCNQLQ